MNAMPDERDERIGEYLWDRSGDPDPDIVRLETMLAPLRHQGKPPQLPRQSRRVGGVGIAAMSAAAALLLLVATAWFVLTARGGWDVRRMAGLPVVDGETVSAEGRLHVGAWLVTNAVSRARIKVGRIGEVDVDPDTRVQLVEARGREHRLALERGTIHARIWAPPKFFYVNTPAATAIDLGCAYTLQVDDSGAGLLRVTSGWVGFERDGRESYIPKGAMCVTRPGIGPGTPYYDDAPSGYGEALTVLDFEAADDPRRAAALDLVLSGARKRDGLTLWHLLTRVSSAERARVFDRLAALAPPPRGVTREAVLRGERPALEQWWDALGVDTDTWWRLWKKKW